MIWAVKVRSWCQARIDVEEIGWLDVAEMEFTPGAWGKDAEPLRYIALRFTPLQSELFEGATVRYHAVVSNRRDLEPAALIEWHRGKAETIEDVHRVLRSELAAGVMPFQLFGANAAWFRINIITYDLLTALKRKPLPQRYRLARPKCSGSRCSRCLPSWPSTRVSSPCRSLSPTIDTMKSSRRAGSFSR